ncbi:MAG: ribbon-helix-helix protein, CopG family, partial [Ktedonobacteraceae bacterium]
MKQRLEIRVDEDMRAGLDLEAQRTGKPLTAIVEECIREGLARRQGKLIEVESLPLLREAVREETGRVLAQLYEKLRTDLVAQNKRDTDRLASLIM